MDYKDKLIQFNGTEKYKKEMEFLLAVLNPLSDEKILDYGCGLGRMVWKLRKQYDALAFGFDVNNFREQDDQFLFRDSFYFPFDKIYFMHSIAHIPDIENVLSRLLSWAVKPTSEIVVITPNSDWLNINKSPDYIPDPTVNQHQNIHTLEKLFVDLGCKTIIRGQFGTSKGGCNERIFLKVKM